jgi:hypothetical protein
MAQTESFHSKKQRFFGSLLGALAGVGFIALSVHWGSKNDLLATLIIKGGDVFDYLSGFGIVGLFILGVGLIAVHVAQEGVAENFYEHTPY